MAKKCGKYVVSVESPKNQPPLSCSADEEILCSACQFPASTNVSGDTSVNVCACTSTGTLGCSPCLRRDVCYGQVKQHFSSICFHWKVFLTCLLACVITVVIGVLIVCLVYKEGNIPGQVIINIASDDGRPRLSTSEHGLTTTTTKFTTTTAPTVITKSIPPMKSTMLKPPTE